MQTEKKVLSNELVLKKEKKICYQIFCFPDFFNRKRTCSGTHFPAATFFDQFSRYFININILCC